MNIPNGYLLGIAIVLIIIGAVMIVLNVDIGVNGDWTLGRIILVLGVVILVVWVILLVIAAIKAA